MNLNPAVAIPNTGSAIDNLSFNPGISKCEFEDLIRDFLLG